MTNAITRTPAARIHLPVCLMLPLLFLLSVNASQLRAQAPSPSSAPNTANSAATDNDREFHWSGRLAADKVLEVKGISGDIRAAATTGDLIEVSAVKTGSQSRFVRVEVVEHADGITICAVYPRGRDGGRHGDSDDDDDSGSNASANRSPSSTPTEWNTCTPGQHDHNHVNNNRVRVDFTVKVPAHVRFVGRTVNGDVQATNMAKRVEVSSVNGSVEASTAEWASARTVNGSVTARMGKADWDGALELSTVNGSVELTFPSSLSTQVRAKWLNGRVDSDFPITTQGGISRTSMQGTIGNGATRELILKTINGSIELRKGM